MTTALLDFSVDFVVPPVACSRLVILVWRSSISIPRPQLPIFVYIRIFLKGECFPCGRIDPARPCAPPFGGGFAALSQWPFASP